MQNKIEVPIRFCFFWGWTCALVLRRPSPHTIQKMIGSVATVWSWGMSKDWASIFQVSFLDLWPHLICGRNLSKKIFFEWWPWLLMVPLRYLKQRWKKQSNFLNTSLSINFECGHTVKLHLIGKKIGKDEEIFTPDLHKEATLGKSPLIVRYRVFSVFP